MKILVTGAAGFIASHVADAYVDAGHEVVIVDDLSRGSLRNVNSRAHFYQCDIRDQAAIEGIFQTEKPAVVNHHAAQMDVRRGVREPLFDADVNILGSINLLGASITHEVKRFIYIASAGAGYGEPQVSLVGEDHPINPITPYGISKHTVEHYLFTFRFLYGLEYAVLRYGNVYGPRQNSQGEAGVFAIFSEQMLAGVQPVIYGDGHKVRDYVYISDVVAANVAALEGGTNEIFNIGTGVETKDLEVFETVRSLLGKEVEPKYAPRRPGEIDRICLDIAKANSLLNWRPVVGLSEGARLTVAYFQKEAVSKAASATS
jgi:UDP-glucose 4-epimerase